MHLTADSHILRRAERITPLPYLKQQRPATPGTEEAAVEDAEVTESQASASAPPPSAVPAPPADEEDFGPPLDPPASELNPQ